MSKERFLTVMVPIKDSDCETTVYVDLASLQTSVPASASNVNKVYKVSDGTYYRSTKGGGSSYSYQAVTEREFPYLGEPMTIYDFTYDATRMGTAPTISAQGVMRFAEKDSMGMDVTLEELWSSECHVMFNGESYHQRRMPNITKDESDARYKYDIEFVSDRIVIENTYFYDVVSPFVTEKPISESSSFSFYGDINELAKRLNASLIRSGLAKLERKHVNYPTYYTDREVPYLSYEQWNALTVDPWSLINEGVFPAPPDQEIDGFYLYVYLPNDGDYNRYLAEYIFVNENGEFTTEGYKVVIGKDKKGEVASSDEKLLSFDNNTVYEALQQFHDSFELDYFVMSEKDGYGNFNGNTSIIVGDCDYDFADWDEESDDYVRDDDGIPMSTSPFDYGAEEELMSKGKTSKPDKIVTRITGVGSTDNLPWHYPNPTPDGWIKPVYKTNGIERQDVVVDYPKNQGSTPQENSRYEKYIKNRIGNVFKFGSTIGSLFQSDYSAMNEVTVIGEGKMFYVEYKIQYRPEVTRKVTLSMSYNPAESGCDHFIARLYDREHVEVDSYNSSQSYASPTPFQSMCMSHDGSSSIRMLQHTAYIRLYFHLQSVPYSRIYDYVGYHYASVTDQPIQGVNIFGYIGENFYDDDNLRPFFVWETLQQTIPHLSNCGYSTNGRLDGKRLPMPRVKGKKYKNVESGTIYKCVDQNSVVQYSGEHKDAFEASPKMGWDEWVRTFLDLRITLFNAQGWYMGNEEVELSDYGLEWPTVGSVTYEPDIFDTIDFNRVKYVTPQPNLAPEIYIRTDGEQRFYIAHNYYPLAHGTPNSAIGEENNPNTDEIVNPIYKKEETDSDDKHYHFENEYSDSTRIEHIENFDDVKPTIEGQTNEVGGDVVRIDVVEEFNYDWTDNDEIWLTNDNGTNTGEYKHPYFFAKLRPLGFNIFDLALQEDMVVSMKTGQCGACNFRIGVDENRRKNPVQLWEYDVYGGETFDLKGQRIYKAGDLRRYVDITNLYYDTNGQQDGYVNIRQYMTDNGIGGGEVNNEQEWADIMYNVYTTDRVENGEVGSTKQNGKCHFEGDVVTSGRFMEVQQDTTENYVWVALMKDTETYGTVMPSAHVDYSDHNRNYYIEPKGAIYTDRKSGNVELLSDEDADKFVLINIAMPQIYLRRAERLLSRKLVAYMHDNNAQKYTFSMKFSSIFLAQSPTTDDKLNENSVVYVLFNRRSYRQYVKHYTYKMSHGEPLPEISIETNDALPLTMTVIQRQEKTVKAQKRQASQSYNVLNQKINEVSKKSNTYVNGGDGGGETVIIQNIQWNEF